MYFCISWEGGKPSFCFSHPKGCLFFFIYLFLLTFISLLKYIILGDGDIAFHGRAWKLPQRSKSMTKYARRSCQLLLRCIHLHTVIVSPQVTFKWILLCWLCTAAAGFMQVPPRGVCFVLPLLSLIDVWSTAWLWVLEAPFPWTIHSWRYIYIMKSSVRPVLDLWDITTSRNSYPIDLSMFIKIMLNYIYIVTKCQIYFSQNIQLWFSILYHIFLTLEYNNFFFCLK